MGNILAPSGASLYDAIAEGNADAAVEVLQAYPDLTRKRLGTKKRTLYHFCAASGQVSVLKSLCEHVWKTVPDESGVLVGAQGCYKGQHPAIRQYINKCDQKGLTPLSLACKKGHAHAVTFLLTQGADPWVKDRMMGRTALHHAARANHPDCIEAILSSNMVEQTSGPDTSPNKLVDHPTNAGYTPLHYAAAAHSREAAAVLLRHGANPNAKTWEMGFEHLQLDRGSTPMHAAGRYQSLDVAIMLLRHWDENLRRLDVTDPRVVENLPRIKPYQMPGVKLNKTLFRVLDPATPFREIRGHTGITRGNAPLNANQRNQTGLQRQDSDLSKLSCSVSGGAEESGPAEACIGDNPLPERPSPTFSMPRQAIAVTVRQVPPAAFKDAPLEPGSSSRDSNGAVNATPADGSSRRSFADANSPTSPVFSPNASSTAKGSPFGGFLAPLGSEIPQDPSLDRSRSSKRLALPTPIILNPHNGAANSGMGSMGRSRSGAIFPMPPPAGGPSTSTSPGPGVLRSRSLQSTPAVQISPSAGTATSPNPLAPAPGSEGRADGRQPHDQHRPAPQPHLSSWVSCATDIGKGAPHGLSPNSPAQPVPGGGSTAAYPGQMPLAAAAASLGFSQGELGCAPFQPAGRQPQPPSQQQQGATLNARPQSMRDGNAYNKLNASLGRGGDSSTNATCQNNTAWQYPQNASSAPASGQLLGGASRELQKASSGGRSLARTLSRKLSSLAAAATAAVRQDSVRVCSSEPLQSGGGTGGRTDSSSPSGSAIPPLTAASGWNRPAALSGTTAGVGLVPPPSVRRAF
ncbi:hypothetical protein Vretimale_5417 [Volvox reticuliferus]|uniref:Uncharacterized protein n=1 Tax=Volvox reticuliferus TaxID=1737510 RepID=A0A8J4C1L0_9CHLO|nr:hypothetical protein Vretifemale_3830 [Volvox reticuliferus]GIM00270.1 hypothetical protein Vretimale_5417 [Volvox reticuliferus]